MKKYMVIERFKPDSWDAVYERLNTKGRGLPVGLNYLNSWVNKEKNICYQLMETNNPATFDEWCLYWNDLVDFEIVPID